MGITTVGTPTTQVNTTSGTTVVLATPAAAAVGDYLVAAMSVQGSTFQSAPAGWEAIIPTTGGTITNPRVYAFGKFVTSGDLGASHTFTTSSSNVQSSGGCRAYRGVDPTTPLDVTATIAESSTTTGGVIPVPGFTVTEGACLIGSAAINSSNTSNTIGEPTGWTEQWDLGGKRHNYAEKLGQAAGATGTINFATSITFAHRAWACALRAAADATTSVTATTATAWAVRSEVATATATSWNVAAPLTTVTASTATTWAVASSVSTTTATTWGVGGTVTQDTATSWSITTSVAMTTATAWAVAASVTTTTATTWNVTGTAANGTVSFAGAGTSWGVTVATTGATAQYPAGSTTDVILTAVGLKPYSIVPTIANQTAVGAVTSGTVANANGSGSTRSMIFQRASAPTEAGSDAITTTLSPSPLSARGVRFARANANDWSIDYVGLADTDETGTAVSATGTATTGEFVAGDMVVIHVALQDDVITHTSQTLAIAGCTVGSITWLALQVTTSGNDAANYLGYATITAGSSTGAVSYTATSNTSGKAGAAVSVARVRAVNVALETVTASVDTSWAVREQVTGATATSWGVGGTVTGATATSWAAASSVTATTSTAWGVRTDVTASAPTAWAVRTAVEAGSPTSWGVQAQITATAPTAWGVRALIESTSPTAWGVRAEVSLANATTWRVEATVPLTAVTASTATTWAARAAVTAAPATAWAVRALITGGASTTWAARAAVTGTAETGWTVRTPVAPASVATTWGIQAQVAPTAASTSWAISEQVTAATPTEYSVLELVTAQVAATWATIQRLEAFYATAWRVINPSDPATWFDVIPSGRLLPRRWTADLAAPRRQGALREHRWAGRLVTDRSEQA